MSCNETAVREVVRHIEMMPKRWYQGSWCLPTDCGTKFCVAGWAARLGGHVDDQGKPTAKGVDLYLQLHDDEQCRCVTCSVISPGGLPVMSDGAPYSSFWVTIGQEVLGLDEEVADRVFNGDYATTVTELKRNLTRDLGITFEEGADPHVP
jgi:hypothetical protein